MTEKETGNAQPGACVDVLPRCLCRPIGKGFLRRFGLETGMVFEGTKECVNVFIVSIPNELDRKRNMRI